MTNLVLCAGPVIELFGWVAFYRRGNGLKWVAVVLLVIDAILQPLRLDGDGLASSPLFVTITIIALLFMAAMLLGRMWLDAGQRRVR